MAFLYALLFSYAFSVRVLCLHKRFCFWVHGCCKWCACTRDLLCIHKRFFCVHTRDLSCIHKNFLCRHQGFLVLTHYTLLFLHENLLCSETILYQRLKFLVHYFLLGHAVLHMLCKKLNRSMKSSSNESKYPKYNQKEANVSIEIETFWINLQLHKL